MTARKLSAAGLLLLVVGILTVVITVIAIATGNKNKPVENPTVSASTQTDASVSATDRSSGTQSIGTSDTNVTEPTVSQKTTDATSDKPTNTTSDKPSTTSSDKPATTTSDKPTTDSTSDKPTEPTDTDTNTGSDPTVEPGVKRVALTFDDGPGDYSKLIADEIEKYGGHVTFFIVGNRVSGKWGEGMKYAAEKGNEIQIHGYTHDYYYDKCSDTIYQQELSKTADAIRKAVGTTPTQMRPIGGRITKARTAACPYAVIHWSVDSNDWKYKNPAGSTSKINTIVNNVLKQKVEDGDIILMHEIYKNSYEAFRIIAKELSKQGFEFVTVTELLNNPAPGRLYHSTKN